MRAILTVVLSGFIMGTVICWSLAPARAEPGCAGCDVVAAGLFGTGLVNRQLYGYDPGTRTYTVVVVRAVRSGGYGPAIQWYRPDNGDSGWDDAHNFYTERSYREIIAGNATRQMSPSEQQERTGLLAACTAAAKADNVFYKALMTNACCNSSAARKYGTPGRVCG